MRFGGIDLPDDLVGAHTDGSLTLFVGAGASKPSGLPDFKGLTRQIFERSEVDPPRSSSNLDVRLGELKELHGAEVNRWTKDIISNPASQPNDLHDAIVELALASQNPRIITTNYDRHLSTCLSQKIGQTSYGKTHADLREYPSLGYPQREDFSGLVYLHGSIIEPAENLVVTDEDFGKAYLSARWTAAQFLSMVFEHSTVLFIGYSHQDTLMKYLARGLTAKKGQQAFALCLKSQQSSSHWKTHGVTAIGYSRHAGLTKALQEWASLSRRGMLEHKRRVKAIVQGSTQMSPADESYLAWILRSEQHRRYFTEQARGAEWLRWATRFSEFTCIFNPREPSPTAEFVSWFSGEYTTDPATIDDALELFRDQGSSLCPELWQSIEWKIGDALDRSEHKQIDEATRQAAKRWIPLLLNCVPPDRRYAEPFLTELLWGRIDPVADRPELLLVLDYLLTPVASLPRFPSLDGGLLGLELELRFRRDHRFTEWAAHTLLPVLEDEQMAVAIAVLADQKLRLAHDIAASEGDAEGSQQLLSFGRSAIEPHDQDRHPNGIDPLIDLARDVLEAMLRHDRGLAEFWLRSWEASGLVLLRRLSIHGHIERHDMSADEKIDWLIGSGNIFAMWVRHEALRLLAVALPAASECAIARLVDVVVAGPALEDDLIDEDREDFRERLIYEWLAWIDRHAQQSQKARLPLEAIQAAHPDWSPDEHFDFMIWSWSEAFSPVEEISPPHMLDSEQICAMIRSDPARVPEWIAEFPPTPSIERPWRLRVDAIEAVRGAVQSRPDVGVPLLLHLIESHSREHPDEERKIAEAVLGAWVQTAKDTVHPQSEIVNLLPHLWDFGSQNWVESEDSAEAIKSDWLNTALRGWAGLAGLVALNAALYEYRTAANPPNALPNHFRTLFGKMLEEHCPGTFFAQEVLAARVDLLFLMDSAWCANHIFPLLDPNADLDRATRCWEAHLAIGGMSAELLRGGLIDSYISMAGHLNRVESKGAFCQRWASIALHLGMGRTGERWLKQFTANAEPTNRLRWMRAVRQELSELPAGNASAHWDSWTCSYWENRLQGIPRPLIPEESTALAGWLPHLGDRFPEAVAIAIQDRGLAFSDSGDSLISDGEFMAAELIGRFSQQEPPETTADVYPEDTTRLVTHMMSNTDAPVDHSLRMQLGELLAKLLPQIDHEHAKPLSEQAERLNVRTFG